MSPDSDGRLPTGPTFTFTTTLWNTESMNAWVFVSLPQDQSADIRDLTDGLRTGFGSQRVRVALNGSRWETSIFPESGSGRFVLPVKKAIRTAEGIDVGDSATFTVELVL
ncbi:DUF1905 domain-containing protein [Cryobacterium sp. SO2]|uniref:DUF1905 domain-containing protein n=1 Tax=Cryobacterium sp. SO2 TaxID=1897060 RepID=UPI00223CB9DA|nr:DUF1905 domain-containing protein [Cryobacterium sp. SO2]WEO76222.1 DUF1905 domain-containing protein [Cryobacterium sp. SO2]